MERKPVKVSFEGRRTGMGASTICEVYSFRQQKKLEPSYTDTSKTGNHWTDYYWLFPARYILTKQEISNAGNHSCFVAVIEVKEDGSYEIDAKYLPTNIPEFVNLPCSCLRVEPQE